MQHSFKVCYEMDVPLALAVAAYLDCEHYLALHERVTSKIKIVDVGDDYYKLNQYFNILGIDVGQNYKASYVPPSTFINSEIQPFPRWLPSIHHLIKTKTTLRYYKTARDTTLSELSVEMDMPFWIYPFRGIIQKIFEKIKIVKDLEDVAMMDRRAKLFGRDCNSEYFKPHQFILHKEEYMKYFGKECAFYGETPEEYKHKRWTNIKDLDHTYVKNFLKKDYYNYV